MFSFKYKHHSHKIWGIFIWLLGIWCLWVDYALVICDPKRLINVEDVVSLCISEIGVPLRIPWYEHQREAIHTILSHDIFKGKDKPLKILAFLLN